MSKHGKLNRQEALELVGANAIHKVDGADCDPTGRLQCDGDPDVEWSASIGIPDPNGDWAGDEAMTLTAYYYTTPEDMDAMTAADGDGSAIDWTVHGYEIS